MEYIEEIVFLLLGMIIPSAYKIARKRINIMRYKRQYALGKSAVNNSVMVLERPVPCFKEGNIVLSKNNKRFYIDIPEKYHQKINDLNPTFGIRQRQREVDTDDDFISHLETIVGITNIRELIARQVDAVAELFISELEAGKERFNGELFGVYKFLPSRTDVNEDVCVKIEYYITDYFTHRVMGSIYKIVKATQPQLFDELNEMQNVNKYYPFLTSFGMCCFIILEENDVERILIGHRSKNVIVDQDKYHFTMNEAFSLQDINKDTTLRPDLMICLERGLLEELGLPGTVLFKQMKDKKFYSLFIDLDKIEMGISCFVRLKTDRSFDYNKLMDLYHNNAKDRRLETIDMIEVHVGELDKFIAENKDKMSKGALSQISIINTMFKLGYLPDGYNEWLN